MKRKRYVGAEFILESNGYELSIMSNRVQSLPKRESFFWEELEREGVCCRTPGVKGGLAERGECPWFSIGGPFWPIDGRTIQVLVDCGSLWPKFICESSFTEGEHDGEHGWIFHLSPYDIAKIKETEMAFEITHWRYLPDATPDWLTFNGFCANVHEDAVEKGWWDEGERPFGEIIALCHAELSEALEEARDGRGYSEIYDRGDGKPEGIPVELADVIIRIADFCGQAGIDLDHAIKIKREYNRTRPRRHGKAF